MTERWTGGYYARVANTPDPDGFYTATIYRGDDWLKVLVERDRDVLVRRCIKWAEHLRAVEQDRERIAL